VPRLHQILHTLTPLGPIIIRSLYGKVHNNAKSFLSDLLRNMFFITSLFLDYWKRESYLDIQESRISLFIS